MVSHCQQSIMGLYRGGERVEDFRGIIWFSGWNGEVICHCEQSIKG